MTKALTPPAQFVPAVLGNPGALQVGEKGLKGGRGIYVGFEERQAHLGEPGELAVDALEIHALALQATVEERLRHGLGHQPIDDQRLHRDAVCCKLRDAAARLGDGQRLRDEHECDCRRGRIAQQAARFHQAMPAAVQST